MARTLINSELIKDGDVSRADLNTSVSGSAVITKVIAGTNITISSTGTDTGTGDVTINATGGSSPLTTKGDLHTYSTADARLPVGTDGQVVVADSTQTTGIKWTTGGVFTENVSSLTTLTLATNNSYIYTGSSPATWTLPTTASDGDIIRVYNAGTSTVTIAQNTGQKIWGDGTTVTTTSTGSLMLRQNSIVDLKCSVTNNEFVTLNCQGTVTTDTGAIARGVRCIVDTYTSSGTWTNRTGAVKVEVEFQAPGGGGGSGRRGAAASVRCGGGGGSHGGFFRVWYDPSQLSATEAVTIGAAGTGGAAVTVDSTNGNNGGASGLCSFADMTTAVPGAGAGGTATTGTGGAAPLCGVYGASLTGNAGAAASTTGLGGGTGLGGFGLPGTGAAGGGISSADAVSSGGIGGPTKNLANGVVLLGGTSGTSGGNGGNGPDASTGKMTTSGSGGGGGASSKTAAAGSGGNGGAYGGGGGGGGASLNSFNSGPGGNGGPGRIRVTTYF